MSETNTPVLTHRCDIEGCSGKRYSSGRIEDNCGEPCSWIMGKTGHGIPPWKPDADGYRAEPSQPD
jgi:hypothetical protein